MAGPFLFGSAAAFCVFFRAPTQEPVLRRSKRVRDFMPEGSHFLVYRPGIQVGKPSSDSNLPNPVASIRMAHAVVPHSANFRNQRARIHPHLQEISIHCRGKIAAARIRMRS